MSETNKTVYASEHAETDETACEDLAAWEQEETGQEKYQRNNCVNAAFKFFVIYKLQEDLLNRDDLFPNAAGKTANMKKILDLIVDIDPLEGKYIAEEYIEKEVEE